MTPPTLNHLTDRTTADKMSDEQNHRVIKPLTSSQIEMLANNIHNVDDFAYTVECLSHHLSLSRETDTPAPNSDADIRAAAAAVIAQWDTPNWKLTEPTAKLINDLRAALATDRTTGRLQ